MWSQASQPHVTSVFITRESVSRYKRPLRLCMRNKILRSANAKCHFFFYKINKRDLPRMYSLCSLVWIKASTSTVFFPGGGGGLLLCDSRHFSLYEVLKGNTEKNSRRSRSCLLEGCPNRRLFSVFFFSVLPFNTSYYEESDRRHTITAKKNPTKLMNSSWKFFLNSKSYEDMIDDRL